MQKIARSVVLLVAVFGWAVSCGGGRSHVQQYELLAIAPIGATVRKGVTGGISGAGNRFIAVAKRADGSGNHSWDLTSPPASAIWNSSNPNVAPIDSLGKFTALSAGTTTISATFGALTASTTLVVSETAPILVAVEMQPGLPLVDKDGKVIGIRMQVLAKYDDGSEQDITGGGIWLSGDISAATVDSSGSVTYKSNAPCTIMFLYGLSYNSMTLTHL